MPQESHPSNGKGELPFFTEHSGQIIAVAVFAFLSGFMWASFLKPKTEKEIETKIVYLDKMEEFKLDTSKIVIKEDGRKTTTKITNKKPDGETTVTEIVDVLLPVVSEKESTKNEKTIREVQREETARVVERTAQSKYLLGVNFIPSSLNAGTIPFGLEAGFRLGGTPAFGVMGLHFPRGYSSPTNFSVTLGIRLEI